MGFRRTIIATAVAAGWLAPGAAVSDIVQLHHLGTDGDRQEVPVGVRQTNAQGQLEATIAAGGDLWSAAHRGR